MIVTFNEEARKANNMESSMLIHPGEMIKDEIMARGLTQKELAQQMGVSYTVFNEIPTASVPSLPNMPLCLRPLSVQTQGYGLVCRQTTTC